MGNSGSQAGPASPDIAQIVSGEKAFGRAELTIEVSRLWAHFGTAPQLHARKITTSLGDGTYGDIHADLAIGDMQHLSTVFSNHREQLLEAANLLTTGDLEGARAIAQKIGLTEADFLDAGGGGWGLLLLVAVVCLTLTGDSPQPTAKDHAQSFTISEENAELMDGLKKD